MSPVDLLTPSAPSFPNQVVETERKEGKAGLGGTGGLQTSTFIIIHPSIHLSLYGVHTCLLRTPYSVHTNGNLSVDTHTPLKEIVSTPYLGYPMVAPDSHFSQNEGQGTGTVFSQVRSTLYGELEQAQQGRQASSRLVREGRSSNT